VPLWLHSPILFNHSMPSSAIFFTSDPENPFGWNSPERELASGHPAHLAVRGFRLGLITATCYEYRQNYSNTEDSPSIFTPPVLWESLCSTRQIVSTITCVQLSSGIAMTCPPSTRCSIPPLHHCHVQINVKHSASLSISLVTVIKI
jgi:hypothetical protein